MNIELYIARIEAYATGIMPEAERRVFEAELASNAELQQAYELYQLGQEVIEQGVATQLRQQLTDWSKEAGDSDKIVAMPPATARRVSMRPMWMRFAAAASVALVIGWFSLQWVSRDYSDEALFAAQYEAPSPGTFRSGTAVENPLETGFKSLENNDLQGAETFFQSVTPTQERYAEAQYYLGHAAGQLGHYDLAIRAFQVAIASNEARFREKAEWNLLLTYMAAQQTESADFKTLLNRIVGNPQHDYHEKAVALQEKLGSFFRKI